VRAPVRTGRASARAKARLYQKAKVDKAACPYIIVSIYIN